MLNLTPHAITVRMPDGTDHVIPPTGCVARVDSRPGDLLPPEKCPDGLPCYASPEWGEVLNLPDSEPGVSYLVSLLVLARCRGRMDVFAPGTGPNDGAIRHANGQIIAVTRLIRAMP